MKVLVADDDAVNRSLLEKLLSKWGYETVLANDGAEAWQILDQTAAPRLALIDWMMPAMDGLQVCRAVRGRSDGPYIYTLLVTAKFQKQDIVEGLEAGADDYVTKPFDPHELRARLRAGTRILELQEQLHSAYERLKFQSAHDPLTGLWNRETILDSLRVELARAQRQKTTLGVVMADLDHFKQVNDMYGHLAGDIVLRETAKRMRSAIRTYDVIGRWGGEEFLVVLAGCDLETAISRAEALRTAVGGLPIRAPEGLITITASLGVTIWDGSQPPDVERLLRAADSALYAAKEAGRNRVGTSPGAQETSGDFCSQPGAGKIPVAS